MANLPAPAALLSHPDLWRAERLEQPHPRGIATGYPPLDALLIDRGWPRGGVVELLCAHNGIGELRLLGPALAELSVREQRWLTWINPPRIPYAPGLSEIGIDIDKVLLVHPKSADDALWALEQALKSGSCSTALAWLDEAKLTTKNVRRLKLAARQGNVLAVLFRPIAAAQRQSMAELRIALNPVSTPDRLSIEVLKRRGGWPVGKIELSLAYRTTRLTRADLRAQLTQWRSRNLHAVRTTASMHPQIARH